VARLPTLCDRSRPVAIARRPARQVQRRLPPDKIAQLVADYQAGTSTNALALNYRISRHAVSKHIKRAGVPFRQRGLPEELLVEAEWLYLSGWSLQRLAEHYGRDDETIRQNLKKRACGCGALGKNTRDNNVKTD
jgi:hypothetical protein